MLNYEFLVNGDDVTIKLCDVFTYCLRDGELYFECSDAYSRHRKKLLSACNLIVCGISKLNSCIVKL